MAFFSFAETVAGRLGSEVDRARAEDCIRRAGLSLDKLPHGIDTRLDKQVNKDGTELSGGDGDVKAWTLADLLPLSFTEEDLKR